ncbi:MAG TPA: hypothetical protein VM099_07240 [Gemmatimonadaceae bacterium]|nr:hypothetical protein [Gemmatimonadaceae bacterium]
MELSKHAVPKIQATGDATNYPQSSVSVVVVAICSLRNIARTLIAIRGQQNPPPFNVIVAADPRLGSLENVRREFPEVEFLSREACRTPIELAALGIAAAKGERILLTEDSCLPDSRWVHSLASSEWQGHGAVGGVIDPGVSASRAMWAFYFVDFFRYMGPVGSGEMPTLSVCNVAYHRSHLEAISNVWKGSFLETTVHDVLKEKFGPLAIVSGAVVRIRRDVKFKDAVYERYAFGRLFGAARVANAPTSRRAYFAVMAPALPVLLTGRMASKAVSSSKSRGDFIKALPSLLTMVAAWSWGEWLGYVTKRRPARITTAPEKDTSLS